MFAWDFFSLHDLMGVWYFGCALYGCWEKGKEEEDGFA
jgi:hypothetical protein